MSFVQLQVISNYSLLQSTTNIKSLVQAAKEKGYQAIALTDRQYLFGQIEFYKACKKAGIKPIIGLQLEVKGIHLKNEKFSLVLLAKNYEGYQKLMQLSTLQSQNNEEALKQALATNMEHVIAITPGEKGEIEQLLQRDEVEHAKNVASYWNDILPKGNYYIGLQLHTPMRPLIPALIEISEALKIPRTAMHDVRYLNPDDQFSTQVLQAIDEGRQIEIDQETLTGEYYLPNQNSIFKHFEQAGLRHEAEQTMKIAESISLEIPLNQSLMPKYAVPSGHNTKDYLAEQCQIGLANRVPNADQRYLDRLKYELDVIHQMGFDDYFLIIWDLMAYAAKKKIFPGAGRGSAAGSLVAYVLRITHVDPIEFDLLFERFLNLERYNMPDIDLDFPDDRREEILKYVRDKYGSDHVAQIMTVGTLAAKMSLRDTARVFGLTTAEAGKWSNAVPAQPGIRLEEAYRVSKSLQQLVRASDRNRLLYETAVKIEGSPRHISTHAAGVVISDQPLVELIPLQQREGDLFLTQYQMGDIEEIGLLKMDFLGLKNLTILNNAIQLAERETGASIDIFSIPLHDQQTLELFRKSDTNGIFQFESNGIKSVLRKLEPESFEDLVAVNALYRPGPMEQIDTFISRKKGLQPIEYLHPDLKPILDVTYGIMVYQEQVMQVASVLAGFTLGEADILRRAIGKKHKETLDQQREKFISGAIKNGYTHEKAAEVYQYIDRFANYGFNRSHSVAYSFIAYQMAYMKTHYPAAFFAALLNSVTPHSDKMKEYMIDIKKRHIELVYPNINESSWRFNLKNQKIQYGLSGIKGLRRDFIKEILTERNVHGKYQDFVQFLRRMPTKWLKDDWIVPMIGSGAFDSFGYNRATLLESLPGMLTSIAYSGSNVDLFQVLEPKYIQKDEFSRNEQMEMEEQYLGYSLSGHPTEEYANLYEQENFVYLAELIEKKTIHTIGLIKNIRRIQTKKGDPMAFVTITDSTGSASLTLFPEAYVRYMRHLKKEAIIVVSGKVDDRSSDNEKSIVIQKLWPVEAYKPPSNTIKQTCYIRITGSSHQENILINLKETLLEAPGTCSVVLIDTVQGRNVLMDQKYHFQPTERIIAKLHELFGKENVVFK